MLTFTISALIREMFARINCLKVSQSFIHLNSVSKNVTSGDKRMTCSKSYILPLYCMLYLEDLLYFNIHYLRKTTRLLSTEMASGGVG